jgi:photosystem II stability/assembly factor-like uncharacterized protein
VGSLPATAAATLVLIDPGQPSRVYAADATTLYRSNDAGQTWEPASQGLSEPVTALALDPREPDRLYALSATGTLFRSEDGAMSWAALPSAETDAG